MLPPHITFDGDQMTLNRCVAFAVALCLGLAAPSGAQDQERQDELISKRDKKLESEFLKKADWITDYDKARAESKKAGKPIFGYFTRSYSP
jgi:hypothetical protein